MDRHGKFLRTVICRRCGLVYSDPRPNTDQVREYYERNYRIDYKATYQPKPKHVRRAGKVAVTRVSRLRDLLKRGHRILDFGAGGGEVVYVLRTLGYDASGFEPNEGYARFASEVLKLPVTHGFYQDAHVVESSLDVITAFHVFEHLESPQDALRHAWNWLRVGGHIWVEVPNVEATCQWPRSRFHHAHLYNVNPATLEGVGKRVGFSVSKTFVSRDGGNLTVVFQKTAERPAFTGEIPGNWQRVSNIVTRHTALRHLFKADPYLRPFRKLALRWEEKRAGAVARSPQEILDALVAAELPQ